MGKFSCRCGYIISDSVYPCALVGELRWQTEFEEQSQHRSRDVEGFLSAVDQGTDKAWVRNYFTEDYAEEYPHGITKRAVIEDITTRAEGKSGRVVYKCPECERMYVQKDFYTDDWTCYEKADK